MSTPSESFPTGIPLRATVGTLQGSLRSHVPADLRPHARNPIPVTVVGMLHEPGDPFEVTVIHQGTRYTSSMSPDGDEPTWIVGTFEKVA